MGYWVRNTLIMHVNYIATTVGEGANHQVVSPVHYNTATYSYVYIVPCVRHYACSWLAI